VTDPPAQGFWLHSQFDIFAWLAAAATLAYVSRRFGFSLPVSPPQKFPYYAALLLGAAIGAYGFGTLNLWLLGVHEPARSIEGALAGGIVAVELFKRARGLTERTGARLAAPFAIGVVVGRIGCFLAGLGDFTYGVPTALPWSHDFGDGIPRHPVQLYESLSMLAFLAFYFAALRRNMAFVARDGFYLAVGFYGLQRFIWEFFKPYAPLLGPFTLFHLLSAALVAYAIFMISTDKEAAIVQPRPA
jgi:phosphatidylglycerol:prolipoprotein diacylglycerol transferase